MISYRIFPSLNIVYEDENIILCDKPAGVLVHSGDGDGKVSGDGDIRDRNTLVYHIQAYLCKKGEYDPTKENSFAPALANRIDRNTGGIVIAAKNIIGSQLGAVLDNQLDIARQCDTSIDGDIAFHQIGACCPSDIAVSILHLGGRCRNL